MDQQTLSRTRQALHGVAELVLAGPQYAESQEIRLRVTPGGFGTVTTPDLRVERARRWSAPPPGCPWLAPSPGLASGAGVQARALRDVYADGPGVSPGDTVWVDPDAAGGDSRRVRDRRRRAARASRPTSSRCSGPSTSTSGSRSPRSTTASRPAMPASRSRTPTSARGRFVTATSGTSRSARRDGWRRSIDVQAVVAFFREGARRASADPPAAP